MLQFGSLVDKLKNKGIHGILNALKNRYRQQGENFCLAWAQSDLLVSLFCNLPCEQPAILLLSLPRSGSTWVGEILGSAKNAGYLFEPINTTYHEIGGKGTLFGPDLDSVPEAYLMAFSMAKSAFAGIPRFSKTVIRYPIQFNPILRSWKRVVIKEVNPLMSGELIKRFKPRIIFLIRHPVAIILSHQNLGWVDERLESWITLNAKYCSVLKYTWNQLKNYNDVQFVYYEDLCNDPINQFKNLYEFADLTWIHEIEQLIKQRTQVVNIGGPYSTTRISNEMKDKWRGQVNADRIEKIHSEYQRYELPWYSLSTDW